MKTNTTPNRKKTIIINRSQIKLTLLMMLIIAVFSGLCILSAFYFSNKNKILTENIITELDETVKKEDDVITAFITYTQSIISHRYELKTTKILEDHNENIETINNIVEDVKKVNNFNLLMVIILAFILLLQTIFFIVFALRQTHKIYGPMFVMTRILEQLKNGEEVNLRPLRKKDEFKQFYELFSEFIKKQQSK